MEHGFSTSSDDDVDVDAHSTLIAHSSSTGSGVATTTTPVRSTAAVLFASAPPPPSPGTASPDSERAAASPPDPIATTTSRQSSRSSLSSGAMESRLSATGNSMKNLKVSMESERMFNDMEDEISQPSPTRDIRSRLSSVRASSPGGNASSGTRVSVKDQLYALECKVQSHEDTIQKLMSIHQADKALLLSKIEEITERMGEELHKLRVDYQKKLNTASEEIERLNKCLNVQRGHITTLQEQCQSLHKHVVQVDDDVTKLATEVLGD